MVTPISMDIPANSPNRIAGSTTGQSPTDTITESTITIGIISKNTATIIGGITMTGITAELTFQL
jgi:hypothetical protein